MNIINNKCLNIFLDTFTAHFQQGAACPDLFGAPPLTNFSCLSVSLETGLNVLTAKLYVILVSFIK